ncbi:hypothetical protein MRX96_055941 [Rhipicephalus microplus]
MCLTYPPCVVAASSCRSFIATRDKHIELIPRITVSEITWGITRLTVARSHCFADGVTLADGMLLLPLESLPRVGLSSLPVTSIELVPTISVSEITWAITRLTAAPSHCFADGFTLTDGMLLLPLESLPRVGILSLPRDKQIELVPTISVSEITWGITRLTAAPSHCFADGVTLADGMLLLPLESLPRVGLSSLPVTSIELVPTISVSEITWAITRLTAAPSHCFADGVTLTDGMLLLPLESLPRVGLSSLPVTSIELVPTISVSEITWAITRLTAAPSHCFADGVTLTDGMLLLPLESLPRVGILSLPRDKQIELVPTISVSEITWGITRLTAAPSHCFADGVTLADGMLLLPLESLPRVGLSSLPVTSIELVPTISVSEITWAITRLTAAPSHCFADGVTLTDGILLLPLESLPRVGILSLPRDKQIELVPTISVSEITWGITRLTAAPSHCFADGVTLADGMLLLPLESLPRVGLSSLPVTSTLS